MTKVLTLDEVTRDLEAIIDEFEADPEKVVTLADDNGKKFVLISPEHYERISLAAGKDEGGLAQDPPQVSE